MPRRVQHSQREQGLRHQELLSGTVQMHSAALPSCQVELILLCTPIPSNQGPESSLAEPHRRTPSGLLYGQAIENSHIHRNVTEIGAKSPMTD